jgi:hypothetical protein
MDSSFVMLHHVLFGLFDSSGYFVFEFLNYGYEMFLNCVRWKLESLNPLCCGIGAKMEFICTKKREMKESEIYGLHYRESARVALMKVIQICYLRTKQKTRTSLILFNMGKQQLSIRQLNRPI